MFLLTQITSKNLLRGKLVKAVYKISTGCVFTQTLKSLLVNVDMLRQLQHKLKLVSKLKANLN